MVRIKEVISFLESIAPSAYQESYDNVGLIVGNPTTKVEGILITLDCTEDVVKEAIEKGCNLIVAHHPIIFQGLKTLTGKNYVERTVINAIKNDIAIYASHTNIDNILEGVSGKIAKTIGLEEVKVLSPKKNLLSKLSFFAPKNDVKPILEKLHLAGAGNIGNYENCSFSSDGIGAFTPNNKALPHIGEAKKETKLEETKVEILLPTYLEEKIVNTLKKHHPYEEVAYYLVRLENSNQEVGSGTIGYLTNELEVEAFLSLLKEKFNLSCIKHTMFHKKKVKKIAICGGSGSFLLKQAIRQSADVFISADFKYHDYFDAENKIIIADIGHYESEKFTKDLFYEILSEKFVNIALCLSQVETNPIKNFIK